MKKAVLFFALLLCMAALLLPAPADAAAPDEYTDPGALASALTAGGDALVKLGGDITLPNDQAAISVQGTKTLDLNGHTLTLGAAGTTRGANWFTLANGAALTVTDSTLSTTWEDANLVVASNTNGKHVFVATEANSALTLSNLHAEITNATGSSYFVNTSRTANVTNCKLTANVTAGSLCLLYASGGNMDVRACTIVLNVTGGSTSDLPKGLSCNNATMTIENTVIAVNTTATGARAISATGANTRFTMTASNASVDSTSNVALTTVELNGGTAELNNAAITASSAGTSGNVTALLVKGTVKLENSDITVNALPPSEGASGETVGLYLQGGVTTMKDTNVSVTTGREASGYGIRMINASRLESMTGGSATVNYTANRSGKTHYGVHQSSATSSIGTISGAAITLGGTSSANYYGIYVQASAPDNLTLADGTTVSAVGGYSTYALYVDAAGFVNELGDVTFSAGGNGNVDWDAIQNNGVIRSITTDGEYRTRIIKNYGKPRTGLAGSGLTLFAKAGQGLAFVGEEQVDREYYFYIYKVKDDQTPAGEPVAAIGSVKYDDLRAAMLLVEEGQTVELLADVALPGTVNVAGKTDITLDLNGKTVTVTGTVKKISAITVNGSSLTITDTSPGEKGKIISRGTESENHGLTTLTAACSITLTGGVTIQGYSNGVNLGVTGDVLNADGVTIIGDTGRGIYMGGPGASTVQNCTITGKTRGVHVNSTAAGAAGAKTALTFTDNTITGSGTVAGDAGFTLNTTGNYTEVSITGGSITGSPSGFYQNTTGTYSTVTISGTALQGASNGAQLKSVGNAANCTVTLTGVTAAGGLYGVTNENMTSSVLTLENVTAIGEVAALNTAANKQTNLSGARTCFIGARATLGDGAVTFPPSYVGFKQEGTDNATGYKKWVMTADASELPTGTAVAEVTVDGIATPYDTFAAAFAEAAKSGGEIKLVDDIAELFAATMTIPAGEEITIDLNGHAFKAVPTVTSAMSLFTNNGTLHIVDSSVEGNTRQGGVTGRGAPAGAGRIVMANPNNSKDMLLVTCVDANSSVSMARVHLEMEGVSEGAVIKLGTAARAMAKVGAITDSTLIAPKYCIYDGATSSTNGFSGCMGDLTNSLFRVTDTVGHVKGDDGEQNNPTAIWLVNWNGAESSVGNIVNCKVESDFYGVSLWAKKVGTITYTDITTKKYHALQLNGVQTEGNISYCTFTAIPDDDNKPGYDEAYVVSLYGATVGSITETEIYGGTGITATDSSIESIQRCEIKSQNTAAPNNGNNTSGTGINLYSESEIRGVQRGGRTIAIANCNVNAYKDGLSLEKVNITGGIVNCTFTSSARNGVGNISGQDAAINGVFDNCTISGALNGMYLDGTLNGIRNCEITGSGSGSGSYQNYALKIFGRVERMENTNLRGVNGAQPFYYGYASQPEDKQTMVLENCTFAKVGKVGGDGYEVKNAGEMTLRGKDSSSDVYQMKSDAVIELVRVQPIPETLILGQDPYNQSKDNNPDGHTLTLRSAQGANITLTRGEDPDDSSRAFYDNMFLVQKGTLKLENITLQGEAPNENTCALVQVLEDGALTVGEGALLTGNYNKGGQYGGAINCYGGTVDLTGGKITGNRHYSDLSRRGIGGAIALENGATLNISGSPEISGNSSYGNGGGIYCAAGCTVTVSGSPVIKNNLGNTGATGRPDDLYLSTGAAITLSGDVTPGADIGVRTYEKPQNGAPVQITTAETDTDTELYKNALGYFHSDDENYAVTANHAGKYLQLALAYTVTVNGTVQSDKAINGVDYTHTIPDYDANKVYHVTVTIEGGETLVLAPDANGIITVPGDKITGNVTIGYTHNAPGGGVTVYTITATANEGGTVSPGGQVTVPAGYDKTFAVTPEEGYRILDVLVDGKRVGPVESYTFKNVREDHSIQVIFRKIGWVAEPEDTGVSGWLNWKEHMSYIQGYPAGHFGPERNMTRAEAAQLFYNLLLEKDVPVTVHFEDVAEDAWYAQAVNTLASLGMLEGVGGGRFEPERNMSRAEFTVIAMRFTKWESAGENIFTDVKEGDWYYKEVTGAIRYGWIEGYGDGSFRPGNSMTRAEVTAIVNRMLARSADRAYVDGHLSSLRSFPDVERDFWAYYDIMEAANGHDYSKEDGRETWTR